MVSLSLPPSLPLSLSLSLYLSLSLSLSLSLTAYIAGRLILGLSVGFSSLVALIIFTAIIIVTLIFIIRAKRTHQPAAVARAVGITPLQPTTETSFVGSTDYYPQQSADNKTYDPQTKVTEV